MTEAAIERKFAERCPEYGWITYKLAGLTNTGKPDRLVLAGGRVFFVEFKRPGQVPTRRQNIEIHRLLCAGFLAFWEDDYVDAEKVIASALMKSNGGYASAVSRGLTACVHRLALQGVHV